MNILAMSETKAKGKGKWEVKKEQKHCHTAVLLKVELKHEELSESMMYVKITIL